MITVVGPESIDEARPWNVGRCFLLDPQPQTAVRSSGHGRTMIGRQADLGAVDVTVFLAELPRECTAAIEQVGPLGWTLLRVRTRRLDSENYTRS